MVIRHWWWSVFVALSIAIVALLIAIVVLGVWSQHARSQIQQPFSACPSLDALRQQLSAQYGERRFAVGTIGDGKRRAMHIYVNPQTRSWTLVGVEVDGTACPIAGGGGFELDMRDARF